MVKGRSVELVIGIFMSSQACALQIEFKLIKFIEVFAFQASSVLIQSRNLLFQFEISGISFRECEIN
jgi:hypothetical protein